MKKTLAMIALVVVMLLTAVLPAMAQSNAPINPGGPFVPPTPTTTTPR